jgi:CRP-like cAMP-binding protein
MAPDSPDLQTSLRLHGGVTIRKAKTEVLFRRGQQAVGMFVIVRGKVSLDFGVDSAFARVYGPGALVGLSATLTRRNYAMTATVTEDAELVFWSLSELDSLLQRRSDLCRQLLEILGERMAENQKMMKAMLSKDQQPLDEQLEQPTAV